MANPFEELLAALARASVRFVTVGGMACALNGHVRTTEDVDILVDAEPSNIQALLDVLKGFGEGHARELGLADFTDEEGAIRIVEDFPLDIFTRMGGRRYQDMSANIARREVAGVEVPFLDAEGLILIKQESLRERDRMDVAALRAARGEGY
jgi:hypothetical protein